MSDNEGHRKDTTTDLCNFDETTSTILFDIEVKTLVLNLQHLRSQLLLPRLRHLASYGKVREKSIDQIKSLRRVRLKCLSLGQPCKTEQAAESPLSSAFRS